MEDWQYKPAGDHGLRPEESLRSLHREAGLTGTITQTAWRLAVRAYLRIYHRFRVEGLEHLPAEPPFVMVANHTSHLDALTLSAALPWKLRRFAFPIAAGDVFFETPAVSWFSAMMLNALPMWRKSCGSHAMQQLRERLISEPIIYVLFPEGTRSRDGQLGRFKPGLGMIVAESNVPVVPCYLHGAHAACPPDRKLPKPLPLHLRIGPPLQFPEIRNERAGWHEIAERLQTAVGALQAPTATQTSIDLRK
ncbi:MAG TPA: lysophospholipid acyltransferase family protein [Chthoniobacter sp.]|jgi:1-acyl-sn-glycerol-3-phosphate acyltransferase